MNPSPRTAWLERALSVALRTGHLLAVTWLAAGVLGAPTPVGRAAAWVFGTGLALALVDLRARRISLRELAGAVVLLKLAASAWMAWQPGAAVPVFVAVVVVSSLVAHAPKWVRHWRPGVRSEDAWAGAEPTRRKGSRRS